MVLAFSQGHMEEQYPIEQSIRSGSHFRDNQSQTLQDAVCAALRLCIQKPGKYTVLRTGSKEPIFEINVFEHRFLQWSDEKGQAMSNTFPTHEEIAKRAYEIYLERNCEPGCALEHWLLAETELKRQRGLDSTHLTAVTILVAPDGTAETTPERDAAIPEKKNG